MHRNAYGAVCGTPARPSSGTLCHPLNPSSPVSPATSPQVKSTVGPVLRSRSASRLSAHRDQSSLCRIDLLPPSMYLVAFQLLLTRSEMRFFSVSLASIVVTSWSFIRLLFLPYHIAYVVSEIKILNPSEALSELSS